MKKVLLTAALLFAGTLGYYSCTEEEPAEPEEDLSQFEAYADADGNVAKVRVGVLETSIQKEKIVDESSIVYDSEGNVDESKIKYIETEFETIQIVPGQTVYMFDLDDWDHYGPSISKDSAYLKANTKGDGFAEFNFDASWFLYDLNYVFVTYDEDNKATKQANVTLKLGKIFDCALYKTGEKAILGDYSNLFKTYELKTLQSATSLTLPWLRDNSEASFKVNIPENTNSWYCELSFTNAEDNSGFKLLADLTKVFDPKIGVALDAVAKITAPDGTEACDLYVFDKENYLNYKNGKGKNTILFEHNFKSGLIKEFTNVKPGEYYFVFHNPYYYKVYANLELVAVVENE